MSDKKVYYDAFYIKKSDDPNYKDQWLRIGVGFLNADGSININLHCSPVDGRIQLRLPIPKDGSS